MTTDDALQRRFEKDEAGFVTRTIVDEVVLVPIRRHASDLDSIYTMNRVAAHIWTLIDGVRSILEIRDAVVDRFDVSAEEATSHLLALLHDLEQIGAIKEV